MESLIYHQQIVFPDKNLISYEKLEKIVKRGKFFYNVYVNQEEMNKVKNENDSIFEKIIKFQEKYIGFYAKLNIKKEFVKFDNGIEDERILRKMEFSIKNENVKYFDEKYGSDINNFIDNLESNYQKIVDKKKNTIYLQFSDISKCGYIKFSNKCTAYLFHELVGHLLEKDYFEMKDNYISKNEVAFPEWLVVSHEDEIINDSLGVGKYDDLGEEFKKQVLISNGKILSCLDRGNYRKSTFYEEAIPRMRTINVFSSKSLEKFYTDNYLIVNKIWAGVVNPITGDVNIICDEVYKNCENIFYRLNGKLHIQGKLKDLIENLRYLDQNLSYKTGKCIKKGQLLNVGVCGPDSVFSTRGLKLCVVE